MAGAERMDAAPAAGRRAVRNQHHTCLIPAHSTAQAVRSRGRNCRCATCVDTAETAVHWHKSEQGQGNDLL